MDGGREERWMVGEGWGERGSVPVTCINEVLGLGWWLVCDITRVHYKGV